MRVIAGRLRGRTFKAPKGLSTRPTTDRVREALFAVLGDIAGFAVLDLYAGSGSLGIEALSRGARSCVFVEAAPAAVKVLSRNLETLGLRSQSELLARRVERACEPLVSRALFDLIVSDPPWTDMEAAERALNKLLRPELYSEAAIVALGHPKTRPYRLDPQTKLALQQIRTWGDASFSVYSSGPCPWS